MFYGNQCRSLEKDDWLSIPENQEPTAFFSDKRGKKRKGNLLCRLCLT